MMKNTRGRVDYLIFTDYEEDYKLNIEAKTNWGMKSLIRAEKGDTVLHSFGTGQTQIDKRYQQRDNKTELLLKIKINKYEKKCERTTKKFIIRHIWPNILDCVHENFRGYTAILERVM